MTATQPRSERMLVVDDDPRIRQMLVRYFEDESFRVTAVADGAGMRAAMQREMPDIVLLDLVLPGGEDGISLARDLRARSDVPIIMLTGRDDVVDRVVGLEVGADDYVAKPFHLRELLARVRTILRRRAAPAPAATPPATGEGGDAVLAFEGWRLDLARRSLTDPDGRPVELTTGEFDMLVVLVRHPGRVFTRDALMDMTRGRTWDGTDRTIDAQILRLRRKIEPDRTRPRLIKSVRGVGYVFAAPSER